MSKHAELVLPMFPRATYIYPIEPVGSEVEMEQCS